MPGLWEALNSACLLAVIGLMLRTESRITKLETITELLTKGRSL